MPPVQPVMPVVALPDGRRYALDVDDLDRFEWRDVKTALDMTQTQVLVALASFDLDAVAAVLWVIRRRDEPDLTFENVTLRLKDVEQASGEAEDPPD